MTKRLQLLGEVERYSHQALGDRVSLLGDSYYWRALEQLAKDRGDCNTYIKSNLLLERLDKRVVAVNLASVLCNPTETKQLSEAKAVSRLLLSLPGNQPTLVKICLAHALGFMPPSREVLERLIQISKDKDPAVIVVALQAISVIVNTDNIHEEDINWIISLSTHKSTDVRNWATFILGTQFSLVDISSTAIKDALFQRLGDKDKIVQEEALVGLAYRKDPRGFNKLIEKIEPVARDARSISKLIIEAAGLYGEPAFYEPLQNLATWWTEDKELIAWALSRCSPDRNVRSEAREIY